MSQEETGAVVADEMSREVDSKDEVMRVEKSEQWFSAKSGLVDEQRWDHITLIL